MGDEIGYEYRYDHVSGFSQDELGLLGYRYEDDADFRGNRVESWLFFISDSGKRVTGSRLWSCWVTGFWMSPARRAYVAMSTGSIDILDKVPDSTVLRTDQLPTAINGLWGLDDNCVFAYGGSPVHGGEVFRFDGKQWTKLPSPPAWLVHMHGCAPDCVYGVGQKGAYRWDGTAWHTTALRPDLSLAGVWVESPDEIYVTDRGGVLFEGSADGWLERARFPGALVGVGKWRGKVWLGGEGAGLLQLDGATNQIQVIKPKVATRYFECRQSLLIPAGDRVVISDDAAKFWSSAGGDTFENLTSDTPFMS